LRALAILLMVGLLVASVGCAPEQQATFEPPPASITSPSHEVTASANGVDLAVTLAPVEGKMSQHDLTVALSVLGPESVEIKKPNGSSVDVRLKSLATGEAVFESVSLDQEAIASQPAGFVPPTSETLSEGEQSATTYRFTAPAGRYVLTARTFDPVVAIQSTELDIP